jgi:hypothetical protein
VHEPEATLSTRLGTRSRPLRRRDISALRLSSQAQQMDTALAPLNHQRTARKFRHVVLLIGLPLVVALTSAVAVAVWRERLARQRRVERPRPVSAALLLVNLFLIFVIVLIETHCGEAEHACSRGIWQPLLMVALPYAIVFASAARYPDVVPRSEQPLVATLFVFIAAAAVNQTAQLWWRTEELQPVLRSLRRATIGCSTAAMVVHASYVAMHQSERLWKALRICFAFHGGLRLVSGTALRLTAAASDCACYFPSNLTFGSSMIVNSSYIALALITTQHRRQKMSAVVSALLPHSLSQGPQTDPASYVGHTELREPSGWASAAPRSVGAVPMEGVDSRKRGAQLNPTPGEQCSICMNDAKDHAFIPCGHLCACASCAKAVIADSGLCPICRATTSSFLKCFHA